jgi:hypothetical protein
MKKIMLLIIMVAVAFIWKEFQGKSFHATTGSESSSNIPPTNLLEQI